MKYKKLPNLKHLKEILIYDKDSGIFYWKNPKARRVNHGDVAGATNPKGYVMIGVDGEKYRAHRLAWYMTTGFSPKDQIDHKNQNKSDNRFSNLRQASGSQNSGNTNARANSETGVKGVSPYRGKYRACIKIKGKTKHLGLFLTVSDAENAYKKASDQYYGDYSVYKGLSNVSV